jgi:hypothetical protein
MYASLCMHQGGKTPSEEREKGEENTKHENRDEEE